MKRNNKVGLLISIIIFSLISGSCKYDYDDSIIIKENLTGYAQKGPFIMGTTVSISELNSFFKQTGKIFTTLIINNKGFFEINDLILATGYVEFSADGYYYDEVKGRLSGSPLHLSALSDIRANSMVNINILTHLEKFRLEYLVKHNKTLSEAKKIAQHEILEIFGISPSKIDYSETLDISVNEEKNAVLLAISVILQGNRSAGELTELLANISNNIREDGILNDETIIIELVNSAKNLSLTSIRRNLENRYQELNLNVTIPGFEKYVSDFIVFAGKQAPIVATKAASFVQLNTATLNGTVNPNYLPTSVSFEWGTTSGYGNSIIVSQTPLSGSTSVNLSVVLSSLSQGTTYHFRIKAENSLGTRYGNDMTFTTLVPLQNIIFNSNVNYG